MRHNRAFEYGSMLFIIFTVIIFLVLMWHRAGEPPVDGYAAAALLLAGWVIGANGK